MSAATYDVAGQKNQTVLTIRRVVAYAVLIILTILSLMPFVLLVINSTRSHYDIMKGFSILPVLPSEQTLQMYLTMNSFLFSRACSTHL